MDGYDENIVLNKVSFTKEKAYILLSTSRGLSIISARTFELILRIESDPVYQVDLVPGTSLLGAVVGDECTCFQLFHGKALISTLTVEDRILNFYINCKRIVILTESRLSVYDLLTCKLLLVIERSRELKGSAVMAGSGPYVSFVCDSDGGVCTLDSFTLFQYRVIHPHTSAVTALALDGTVLATASAKGTLARVFRVPSMELICVFRRGRTESPIKSLELTNESWLCVTGESDTSHIFKLPKLSETSTFRLAMGAALKYLPQNYKDSLEALRDFAHVKLRAETGYVATWVDDDTVVVVSEETGFAFVYLVDTQKGGECKLLSEYALLTLPLSLQPTPKQLSPVAHAPPARLKSEGSNTGSPLKDRRPDVVPLPKIVPTIAARSTESPKVLTPKVHVPKLRSPASGTATPKLAISGSSVKKSASPNSLAVETESATLIPGKEGKKKKKSRSRRDSFEHSQHSD